jgi:hypothetical protein
MMGQNCVVKRDSAGASPSLAAVWQHSPGSCQYRD